MKKYKISTSFFLYRESLLNGRAIRASSEEEAEKILGSSCILRSAFLFTWRKDLKAFPSILAGNLFIKMQNTSISGQLFYIRRIMTTLESQFNVENNMMKYWIDSNFAMYIEIPWILFNYCSRHYDLDNIYSGMTESIASLSNASCGVDLSFYEKDNYFIPMEKMYNKNRPICRVAVSHSDILSEEESCIEKLAVGKLKSFVYNVPLNITKLSSLYEGHRQRSDNDKIRNAAGEFPTKTAFIKSRLIHCRLVERYLLDRSSLSKSELQAVHAIFFRIGHSGEVALHEIECQRQDYLFHDFQYYINKVVSKLKGWSCDSIKKHFCCENNCGLRSPAELVHELYPDKEIIPFYHFCSRHLSQSEAPSRLSEVCKKISLEFNARFEFVIIHALASISISCLGRFCVLACNQYEETNIYLATIISEGISVDASFIYGALINASRYSNEPCQNFSTRDLDVLLRKRRMKKIIIKSQDISTRKEKKDVLKELGSLINDKKKKPTALAPYYSTDKLAKLMINQNDMVSVLDLDDKFIPSLGSNTKGNKDKIRLIASSYTRRSCVIRRPFSYSLCLKKPCMAISTFTGERSLQKFFIKKILQRYSLQEKFIYYWVKDGIGLSQGLFEDTANKEAFSLFSSYIQKLYKNSGIFRSSEKIDKEYINLADEAIIKYKCFICEINNSLELLPGSDPFRSWLSGAKSLILKIAGLIHIFETDCPERILLSGSTMSSAWVIFCFLRDQAKFCFDTLGHNERLECAKAIYKWYSKMSCQYFWGRDAHRAVRGRFSTSRQIKAGLEELIARGYIEKVQPICKKGTGQKKAELYWINPRSRHNICYGISSS